jgi:hypothetical protein
MKHVWHVILLLGPEFRALDTVFFHRETWKALRREKWIEDIVIFNQRHVRLTAEGMAFRDRVMILQVKLLNKRMYDAFGRRKNKDRDYQTTIPLSFDPAFIYRVPREPR